MIFHASLVLFSQNILRKIRLRLMNTLRKYQLMNTKKFSDIAELIYLMVNQLAENEMLRQQQYDSHKIQEQKLTSKINELEYENSSLTKELKLYAGKIDPSFYFVPAH
mgnify:CR=1 FL=1